MFSCSPRYESEEEEKKLYKKKKKRRKYEELSTSRSIGAPKGCPPFVST
jgi:hypothetical protein